MRISDWSSDVCSSDLLGLVNPRPELAVEQITPVAGALDGQNAFGFLVATRAMAAAMEMARQFGIGLVAARHSTHFGMAACYVLQAVEQDFLSLVFTNASRAMPPWGGRRALLGTSRSEEHTSELQSL